MTEVARYTQLILPVFWLGMVVAISFLEAPIKFRAPGVTLAIGLGIGRKVFLALNAVELVLALALLASCVAAPPGATALTVLALVTVVLVVQIAVVRPPLSKRSDRILAGEHLPRSRIHLVYIGLEVAKVALLIALIFQLFRAVASCLH
ncbi:hypothetical protein [Rhodococcus opacus]|uniref:Hypothetical membrane protein n=1 Tax=Rhodococcus opacus (strain B4) TaxID=632772 RepID=C1AS83_RHOOB|nr:hypothetical protein [Rhodococcus opacus]BAH48332.1 hypothetical membrane protein [Rhodococcus opacus B4]